MGNIVSEEEHLMSNQFNPIPFGAHTITVYAIDSVGKKIIEAVYIPCKGEFIRCDENTLVVTAKNK